jgi:predicted transcriptional regulator
MSSEPTPPDPERLMILSVHPYFVSKILDGSKTVELRRTRPAIQPGQPVAIYATMPDAAVVATCRIARVETGSTNEIWSSTAYAAGVTRGEFNTYFRGSRSAVALHLEDVALLVNKVELSQLRARGEFHPPQTWHFFDAARLRTILGWHPSSNALRGLLEPSPVT